MKSAKTIFGGKIRCRVSGLCFKGEKILLVKHNIDGNELYSPPGGAVEFGEPMHMALLREFKEETNLEIEIGDQIFISEYINPPLHAIEIFYKINTWRGKPCIGTDPEMGDNKFILDVDFYSKEQIKGIANKNLHHILHNCNNPRELLAFSGFITPPLN